MRSSNICQNYKHFAFDFLCASDIAHSNFFKANHNVEHYSNLNVR